MKDTTVWTINGEMPIQNVRAGDWVWSYNEEADLVEPALVLRTFTASRSDLIRIDAGGATITCSSNHRFFTSTGEWVAAANLSETESLTRADTDAKRLQKVVFSKQAENQDRKVQVYNFEVRGNHNYFVGSARILCHNVKMRDPETGLQFQESSRRKKHNIVRIPGYGILEKVSELELYYWTYNWEPDKVRHIGPMAEEFYSAFAVGSDNSVIHIADSGGVALAAIKELADRSKESDRKQKNTEAAVAQLQAIIIRNKELEATVDKLQSEVRQTQNANAELLRRLELLENSIRGTIPDPPEKASIPKRE